MTFLCSAVKAAAKAAGAFGCTISGAGPTCVAVTNNRATGEAVAAAMAAAFKQDGGLEVMIAQDYHITLAIIFSRWWRTLKYLLCISASA